MRANPVVWFEIPVVDIDRAKQFYETVFDCSLQVGEMDELKMTWFSMSENSYGAAGALILGDQYRPANEGTLVYFGVESIEQTLAKVLQAGGKTLLPKKSIGEYGFIAHFEDSEGNRIALHSVQ